jgi:2-haloalkanoic acid dehalogenase type II
MIKVVSFDIFQTLVNVNARIPQIWAGILGPDYTEEKAVCGAKTVLQCYPEAFNRAVASGHFSTMEAVYLDCASDAVKKAGYALPPENIVYHLLYQHSQAPLYDDVTECMASLHKRYQIILSSDSNHLMTDDLLKLFIYDRVFISDDLRSYKGSPNGIFFAQVVRQMGVKANEIIHVGDSVNDVLGAQRAGIVSCWLNRNLAEWKHPILPDYTINRLSELDDMLS